jgi:prephenate dehydrogenase
MRPRRLSILGVGLLGGSLGLAVKSRLNDCAVVGYGHRAETLDAALKCRAIDEAYDQPQAAVRGADLVILCTPVGVLEPLLAEITPALSPGAVVTDVGSTKRSVVAGGERYLPAGTHFVGSHPMAGSEKRGVQYARADLFDGARCIVTPTERSHGPAVEAVEAFWQVLGMTTTRLSPADHDRLIADISHLPHAVAAALVTMQHEQALPLAGKGFLDLTRIAGGDGGLWRDIFTDNADHLRASIARLHDTLGDLLRRLDDRNPDAVKNWLDSAAERRRRMLEQRAREGNGE